MSTMQVYFCRAIAGLQHDFGETMGIYDCNCPSHDLCFSIYPMSRVQCTYLVASCRSGEWSPKMSEARKIPTGTP